MTRRASLPGADELLRRTAGPQPSTEDVRAEPGPRGQEAGAIPDPLSPGVSTTGPIPVGAAVAEQPAAKPRHDEKVTFYCTGSELTRLEKARLTLRSDHKLPSDRGRIVRAALAEMLEDFEAKGPRSALLRRLSSEG